MYNLKVTFIRHGETQSNVRGLISGRSDVLVSQEGWRLLKELKANYSYPTVEKVYSSPAIRCRETASVFFPEHDPVLIDNLWEFDFGHYDNRPVAEMYEHIDSEKWLRQDSDLCFPGGESLLEGSFRARAAMTRVVADAKAHGLHEVAVVSHGETLALLLQYCLITDEPRESFVLCPNGMGYSATIDADTWFENQKLYFDRFIPEGAPRPKPEDSPYFSRTEAEK